jgi:acyl-CoA synthetase (AMP-forming)/AMP-acid ligase II
MEASKVIGIVAKNSLSYVKAVFDAYQANSTVVLLRSSDDQTRIDLTKVTTVIEPEEDFGWFDSAYDFGNSDSVAQVSFTSGTEGEPKGVLLTHKALSDVSQRLNDIMELDSSIREYVGVPAHFSFGLGRFRAIANVGGAAYLPEAGFNPLEIRDMLKAGKINAISAVPTLWRVLLKNKSLFSTEALNLKWIEIGSQYMSRQEKEELKTLFPKAIIVQHYGLTEASRTTFLRIDQVEGELLESVGMAVGSTELKISASGRICIRGDHVASTLIKMGEFTSNVDDSGWFETNDLGTLEDGYLYYQGRADDLINCSGIKLSPDALERDLREYLEIKEGITISSYDDSLTGNGVLIALKKSAELDLAIVTNAATDILSKYGLHNKNVIKVIVLDEFPVTSTGKVQRKELAKLYKPHNDEKIAFKVNENNSAVNDELSDDELYVQSIWQQVLNIKNIDIDSNYYQLGGDSLSAISAVIEMEQLGNVPSALSKGMLQGLTIKEIAQQLTIDERVENYRHTIRSPEVKAGITINVIRGFLVLCVILAHWSDGILERLPTSISSLSAYLSPLLSIGTPGFSLIYGVGAGYSLFSIYQSDPLRLKRLLHKTVVLLSWGILALALVHFVTTLIVSTEVTFTDFTNSFYSVLTYYLLISLTLSFWFKVISLSRYPAVWSLLLALIVYSIHTFGIRYLAIYPAEGIVEFIKLLFTAKYSYFLMLTGTMIGISIGMHIRQLIEHKKSLDVYMLIGMMAMLLGFVISVHAGDQQNWLVWPSHYNHIWRWILYAGVILVMLSAIDKVLFQYDYFNRMTRYCIQFFAVIGILAFPLFITHEMVLPIKSVLVYYNMNTTLAMLIPLLLFIGTSYLMFRKIRNVSFL